MDRESRAYQLASGRRAIRRATVLKMKTIPLAGIETRKHKPVLRLAGRAAAERKHHTFAAGRIPVLDSIPVHAVRARRNVVESPIANQRPKLALVERNGILRGLVLRSM